MATIIVSGRPYPTFVTETGQTTEVASGTLFSETLKPSATSQDLPPSASRRVVDLLSFVLAGSIALTTVVTNKPFINQSGCHYLPPPVYKKHVYNVHDQVRVIIPAKLDQVPRQRDWPVPKGAKSYDLLTWAKTPQLQIPLGSLPRNQYDWPVPKGPRPTHLLGIQQGQSVFYQTVVQVPPHCYDWPNPRGPIWPVELRTWLQTPEGSAVASTILPKNNYDWPNPQQPRRSIDALTWVESGNALVETRIFIKSGTTFLVPYDLDVNNNKIECIGGGSGGSPGVTGSHGGAGGGAGAYSCTKNLLGTPGATVFVQIGQGGTPGNSGTDSWLSKFAGGPPATTGAGVLAKGGSGVNGGLASAGIGTFAKFNGGNGGATPGSGVVGGSGGGGAGGPYGNGAIGGAPSSSGSAGGAGGGGDGGGSAGLPNSAGTGGKGGNNWQGQGGGLGNAAGTGGSGFNGGGGGGGSGVTTAGFSGAPGSTGIEWDLTHGSGGGAGGPGGGTVTLGTGTTGGLYGGGASGGAANTSGFSVGGTGGVGIIVFTYTPQPPTPIPPGCNYDWPNPQRPLPRQSWVDYAVISIPATRLPQQQFDWPNPKGKPANLWYGITFSQSIIPAPNLTIFPNFDWPNPRGKPPTHSLSFIDQTIINIPAPLGKVPRQRDWPNPTLGKPRNDLLKFTDNLTFSVDQLPKNQSDWPVPKTKQPVASLYTIAHNGARYLGKDSIPPQRFVYDYPNPRGPRPTHLLGFEKHVTVALPSTTFINNQDDWPNPQIPRSAHTGFIDHYSYMTLPPNSQKEWPNPRGPKPGQWFYKHQDFTVVFVPPVLRPRSQETPLPVRKSSAVHRDGWIDHYSFLGTFPPPPQHFCYDWPNPIRPTWHSRLVTHGYPTQLIVPAIVIPPIQPPPAHLPAKGSIDIVIDRGGGVTDEIVATVTSVDETVTTDKGPSTI